LSIPLGKLGYLAPRIHRVLSESLSESLSNQNSIEAGRRIPVIGRLFSSPPEDPEANLATRVRQGTVPITRTGCGILPSKINERELEILGKEASGSRGTGNPGNSGARADCEAETGGAGTRTPAKGVRREIVFFDEVVGAVGSQVDNSSSSCPTVGA
jgi:hypothetical protein